MNVSNIKEALLAMKFSQDGEKFEKYYKLSGCKIIVDTFTKTISYPDSLKRFSDTTIDFSHPENFVVLECINRLLEKGYQPKHIALEKTWKLGHTAKSGRADICVSNQSGEQTLFIIECKTWDKEYKKELNNMKSDGGQLFSYWQQEKSAEWLCLYASHFDGESIVYCAESVKCRDDANILKLAEKDESVLLYQKAHTVPELVEVWKETYEQRFTGDVIFDPDTVAYNIGEKPLRKRDLRDFSADDSIVNKFEEILRHNNISDKENAFNRLIALFICKLVDEEEKGPNDEVEFQYKVGTDTYELLQDRLQRLHKDGMKKYMKEDIEYVPDSYANEFAAGYKGANRKKMIEELKQTLRILKFYTNNDFAFKDVHNEELFFQNGKVLVEVVQLFQPFRIVGSGDLQFLGDMFEQLLNKGFKQNEGQFFTPSPITRFIWSSLPLARFKQSDGSFNIPRVVDYACGAGHFLTEGIEMLKMFAPEHCGAGFERDHFFGIEKDYRLARVSKIALYMHGAGEANIIFGDGLEDYKIAGVKPESFDILVANPPYSVKSFKAYLKLKENKSFRLLDRISNDSGEIEVLFVERIAQMLKPQGLAAVVLPVSILSNDSRSYEGAREEILRHFYVRAIVSFGSKTFGATGTNTVVLFLEKTNLPPQFDKAQDTADAIVAGAPSEDWGDNEVLAEYMEQIKCSRDDYMSFINGERSFDDYKAHAYFKGYLPKKQPSPRKKNEGEEEYTKRLARDVHAEVVKGEREKLQYFAMVHHQQVLIVTAPPTTRHKRASSATNGATERETKALKS